MQKPCVGRIDDPISLFDQFQTIVNILEAGWKILFVEPADLLEGWLGVMNGRRWRATIPGLLPET